MEGLKLGSWVKTTLEGLPIQGQIISLYAQGTKAFIKYKYKDSVLVLNGLLRVEVKDLELIPLTLEQ